MISDVWRFQQRAWLFFLHENNGFASWQHHETDRMPYSCPVKICVAVSIAHQMDIAETNLFWSWCISQVPDHYRRVIILGRLHESCSLFRCEGCGMSAQWTQLTHVVWMCPLDFPMHLCLCKKNHASLCATGFMYTNIGTAQNMYQHPMYLSFFHFSLLALISSDIRVNASQKPEMVWLIKTPLRQREFWLFLADFNWNWHDLGLITIPDND